MNIELLRRIQAHNTAHPEQLDMEYGICKSGCKTIGCIAGHACLLMGEAGPYNHPSWYTVHSKAAKLLELSGTQSMFLFFDNHWPKNLRRELSASPAGTPQYAQAVNAGIDWFIATGGAE